MLNRLSATEFLNFEHGKFSKSNDRGVFGDHAMESGIPSEVSGCGRGVHLLPLMNTASCFSSCVCQVWRYYLLAIRPESADADFVWTDFAGDCGSSLGQAIATRV